jgi:MGT family glycosyltransferase
VSQTVAGFDFPRRSPPPALHHVGPLRPSAEAEPPLPFAVRDDRPFVFASLGTLQGWRYRIFRATAQACRALDVQLLVAHCGGLDERQAASLGATWVTDFAQQRAVLARATLAVTHAGLNTALDALSFGVPMLAVPIAFDQPGVAARIVHAGVGERLGHRTLTAGKVGAALERLLSTPAYRERAKDLGGEIARSGGARRAADIIEDVTRIGDGPIDPIQIRIPM